ncbi:unnamed protein product [Chrysoparadoxa australica]
MEASNAFMEEKKKRKAEEAAGDEECNAAMGDPLEAGLQWAHKVCEEMITVLRGDYVKLFEELKRVMEEYKKQDGLYQKLQLKYASEVAELKEQLASTSLLLKKTGKERDASSSNYAEQERLTKEKVAQLAELSAELYRVRTECEKNAKYRTRNTALVSEMVELEARTTVLSRDHKEARDKAEAELQQLKASFQSLTGAQQQLLQENSKFEKELEQRCMDLKESQGALQRLVESRPDTGEHFAVSTDVKPSDLQGLLRNASTQTLFCTPQMTLKQSQPEGLRFRSNVHPTLNTTTYDFGQRKGGGSYSRPSLGPELRLKLGLPQDTPKQKQRPKTATGARAAITTDCDSMSSSALGLTSEVETSSGGGSHTGRDPQSHSDLHQLRYRIETTMRQRPLTAGRLAVDSRMAKVRGVVKEEVAFAFESNQLPRLLLGETR